MNPPRVTMRRASSRLRLSRKNGFALLLVLFLTILLTVMVAGFASKTSTAARLARSRADNIRLLAAASSAVEESKARLWQRLASSENPQPIHAPPLPERTSGNGIAVRIEYEDEAGKLPINDFASAPPATTKELLLSLARLFDKLDLDNSTRLATAVKDFIDKDSDGLSERRAKNSEIFHASELVAAYGFSFETLYYVRQEGLPPAADCISTWHTGAVNVNSASPVVFASIAPRLTSTEIEAIMAARAEAPFISIEDLRARVTASDEATAQLTDKVKFSSDTFTLRVEARKGSIFRRIKAVVSVESGGAHTLYVEEGWDF